MQPGHVGEVGVQTLAQVLGLYIASSGNGGYKDGLKRLMYTPQIYAVAAALLARWAGPEILTSSQSVANDLFRGISLLGDAAIPLLLVILGMQLAQTSIDRADRTEISLAVTLRLLVSIPLAYGIAQLLGLDPLSTKLAIILGSMPTSVNVIIMAAVPSLERLRARPTAQDKTNIAPVSISMKLTMRTPSSPAIFASTREENMSAGLNRYRLTRFRGRRSGALIR